MKWWHARIVKVKVLYINQKLDNLKNNRRTNLGNEEKEDYIPPTHLRKIARALEQNRRLGIYNPILSGKAGTFSEDPALMLRSQPYKDTAYGMLMLLALQKRWGLPDAGATIRKCVAVLFKHLQLEVTPAMLKEMERTIKIERDELDLLMRCANEIEERIGLNDPQTCYAEIEDNEDEE